MQQQKKAHATIVAVGLFATGLLCGALAGRAAVARAQDPYAHLDLFARVLTTIQRDYVQEIPTERLVSAAIRGMIDELDSQSRWLDADALQDLRDDAAGETTGFGIEIAPSDGGVEVVRVLPDSPASRDGLVPGDRILEVDGQALAGLDLGSIRAQFGGERGAKAALTVFREGWDNPRTIETVRDTVRRTSVSGALLPPAVAYVRLSQFQEGAGTDVLAEVAHLAAKAGGLTHLSGLVLDLRDNPGGLLSEAVAVTDLFLDEGTIVSTQTREGVADEEVHLASVGGLPQDLRVVVLINGMSASASEIVAGALQDTGRGVLVGEHSYGKGTVQQVYLHTTPENAALKLTVGRYYTPSGAPVAASEGRVPDHIVVMPRLPSPADLVRRKLASLSLEAQDQAEIEALLAGLPAEGGTTKVLWDIPVAERLGTDPQLAKALELARAGTSGGKPPR